MGNSCLLHTDVHLAEFLGIHHAGVMTPAYIFDEHLQPVAKFVVECKDVSSHFKRLFRQIADGLNYLHSKGMVHMELTSSTMTVTDIGEVRMTGACIPRYATLPLDKESPVAEFVYLAPEVLRNEVYIPPSDVYGFGLLLFEILSETKAFHSKRNTTFNDFVETVNPESIIHQNRHAHSLTEDALNLINRCVVVSENNRPNMNIVLKSLDCIKEFKKRIRQLEEGCQK